MDSVQIIDLTSTFPDSSQHAKSLAFSLHKTGCVLIKHPLIDESINERFLKLMERYFSQSDEAKNADARPSLFYQVGATPSNVERPRILSEAPSSALRVAAQSSRAVIPSGPDPKWRFFWRVGGRDSESSKFRELHADPVIPRALSDVWTDVMDDWGSRMLGVAEVLSSLLEQGLGLDPGSLCKLMVNGPHLLGPTGSYLGPAPGGGDSLGKVGTVLAGYHTDLNFLTIHGRSRYQGLNIFTRDGEKIEVVVPHGFLFVQGGRQLEWLTGGHVLAGPHEVVVSDKTLQGLEEEGRAQWRVSSTFFAHINSNRILQPLGRFANPESVSDYPAVLCGDQVKAELSVINLSKAHTVKAEVEDIPETRDQVS